MGFTWFKRLQYVELWKCLGNWECLYITNGTHDGMETRNVLASWIAFINPRYSL